MGAEGGIAVQPRPISGFTPLRVDRMSGMQAWAVDSGQHRVIKPRSWATADQVSFSAESRSMGRLLRMWGALSSLFGRGAAQPSMPDLGALREALQQAQRNIQEVRQRQGVLDTLKSSALQQAEVLVEKYYGLRADGAPLRVALEEDMGGALAAVSYRYDRDGRATNQTLHISLQAFSPDAGPNGTNGHVIENDRIVAHELTHAVMGRTMNFRDLPEWFREGTAEYIAGGAERVGLQLKHLSPQGLMEQLARPWSSDSAQYAAAYVAVRYLDQVTAEGGGLKAVMSRLQAGDSLDQAIAGVSGGAFADTRHLLRHAVDGGAGAAFLRAIEVRGRDPGSIKPGAGPDIVPDQGARMQQPLRGFRVDWPSPLEGMTFPMASLITPAVVTAAYRAHQPVG